MFVTSSFLLENSFYFGVSEIISFQKLVRNLDMMTIANLGGNTRDLWTFISRVFENVCIRLEL